MNEINPFIIELQNCQKELEQYNQELTERLEHASAYLVSSGAEVALDLYTKINQKIDSFYDDWGKRMLKLTTMFGFEPWWQESYARDKGNVLWLLGQANQLLGRLNQAYDNFNQVLSYLGKTPSWYRAMAWRGMADVSYQMALFDRAVNYYKQAIAECKALQIWDMACQTLTSLADCEYGQSNREEFLNYLDEAISIATQYGLDQLHNFLMIKKYRFRLDSDFSGDTLQEIDQKKKDLNSKSSNREFNIDLHCMLAEFCFDRNDLDTAVEELESARDLASEMPSKLWSVNLQFARLFEGQGEVAKAIEYALHALNIAREINIQQLILQTLQTLIPLRLKKKEIFQRQQAELEINELRKMGLTQELAITLLARALVYYHEQQLDLALADIDEAQKAANTRELLFKIYTAKTTILQAMGRKEESLRINIQAIELLNEQLVITGELALIKWKDLLRGFLALHENAAVLSAELGRLREAFQLAEASKAQVLYRKLVPIGISTCDSKNSVMPVNYDELRELLCQESSAMAMYCLGGKNTLVLIIDPNEQQPLSFFLDFSEHDLERLLPMSQAGDITWNEALARALPILSTRLSTPLKSLINRYQTLYLVLDSRLYCVPFAALAVEDGMPLIKHFALVHVPSAAILKWCLSRRVDKNKRNFLAVGVGSELDISFSSFAKAIFENVPMQEKELLCDEQATIDQFLNSALHSSIIHISCHGRLEEQSALDLLSASRLELAHKQMLTAKQIAQINGQLHAELVFLNACVSGKFKFQLGSEVGGFWDAFLQAGATSLIATLTYVHPQWAQKLALSFYHNWLTEGCSKAEALRRAQFNLYQQNIEPLYWASHILVGDHS